MARVVFMGTPDFAVPSLMRLIATQEVVGVVTQPDRPAGRGRQLRPSPVKTVAERAGIPLYQPGSLRRQEAAAPVQAWQPEIIVVAAFSHILRPHILDLPPHGCLNVHASLLPRWRGAAPIQHAILAGDKETGITLMRMDVGLDTGPWYARQAIPIRDEDTAATLHDRLARLGAHMLEQHLDDIIAGRLVATPQVDAGVTYAPMIKKEDGRLDWADDSLALKRQIQAMIPWPGAFTTWKGHLLRILEAQPVDMALPSTPGLVVTREEKVVVRTGDSGLLLQKIQLAGKKAMDVVEFVRGQPDFIGSILGD